MSENTTTDWLVEELRALWAQVADRIRSIDEAAVLDRPFGGAEYQRGRRIAYDFVHGELQRLLNARASRTAEARTVDAPRLLLGDGYAAYGTDWDAAQRLVVRGSNNEGQTIVLEQVWDGEDPTERRRVWSVPGMSKPFNHDVHLARERVTTTYERVAPEAVSADD